MRTVLTFAGCLALALLTFRDQLGLTLLGLDMYPTILSARILSWSDFVGTFTEELMDGRFPAGRFYRPVMNLSIALDYALSGLEPLGYHLQSLVVLALGATLLASLARRLSGVGVLGSACAAALFVVHPIQVEVIPYPPRRADLLCLVFVLAAVRITAGAAEGRPPIGRAVGIGLLVLCAILTKETGVVAAVLTTATAFLRGRPGERLRAALPCIVAGGLAVTIAVAARFAVLGELGGYRVEPQEASDPSFLTVLRLLLYPQAFLGTGTLATLAWSALAVALAIGGLVTARARRARVGLGLAVVWAGCLMALLFVAGRMAHWYVAGFLVPFGLGCAAMVDDGLRAWRERRRGRAAIALPVLVAFGALVPSSTLVSSYPDLTHADRIARAQLDHFERLVTRGRPGRRAVIENFVVKLERDEEDVGLETNWIISAYGLRARAELLFPDRPVRVIEHRGGPLPKRQSPRGTTEVYLITGEYEE